MTIRLERSEPGATTDRSPSDLRGTWTIDPADSTVSFAWRIMVTLTTHQTLGLVELRLAVDPEHSRRDWLVLRGRGVLERRALPTSRPAWSFDQMTRLELAVHAKRMESG